MLVVADSSALLALAACRRLDLLERIFTEVRVPQAVFSEVAIEGKPEGEALRNYLSGKVVSVDLDAFVIGGGDLGRGELEAMALCKHLRADFLLADDRKARNAAKANNIEVVGTLGLLIVAKRRGMVDALSPLVARMVSSGIRISERLIKETLALAGEA
jgi:predicted nucleic acid-binding protein